MKNKSDSDFGAFGCGCFFLILTGSLATVAIAVAWKAFKWAFL